MSNNLSEVNNKRRKFLQQGLVASGVLAIGPALWGCSTHGGSPRAIPNALRIVGCH